MTWLEYDGTRYDLQEATQRSAIRDLVELKKLSGISVRTIADTLIGMGEMESPLEIFDEVERLEVFAAMLFLCKRKAGDTFSWDDALSASLIDISLDFGEAVEEDPKVSDLSTPETPSGEAAKTSKN